MEPINQNRSKMLAGLGLPGKVATTLQIGQTKKENLVVNYILLNMAKLMLANVAPDDKLTRMVRETAEEIKRRIQASHTEEELVPVKAMTEAAVAMARMLGQCKNIDALHRCRHYMDELAANRVLIMEDDLDIDTDALTLPAASNGQ